MAKQERIEQAAVCREIGARTGGDILIGVVGPVRTGKVSQYQSFGRDNFSRTRRTRSSAPAMSCPSRQRDAPS